MRMCPSRGAIALKNIDCLLISTGRAGSTAIYQYLDAAGALGLPANKEPHHWCDIRKYSGLYEGLLKIYTEDVNDYWELYDNSRIVLDASCGYFYCIEEVIGNLRAVQQKPRVIFLYREPVSRAFSFFWELSRKQLTDAESLNEDLLRQRPEGLWWEHYYDNVLYDRCFSRLVEYFDEVIAINYELFAKDSGQVLTAIMDFLQIQGVGIDDLLLEPVNTSREARAEIFARRYPRLQALGARLPSPIKTIVRASMGRFIGGDANEPAPERQQVEACLQASIDEYARFRERVGNRDIVTVRSM